MTTRDDREHMIAIGTTTVEAELAFVENKLQQAIRERDEARREVCSFATRNYLDNEAAIRRVTELARCDPKPAMSYKDAYSMNYAEKRGWDCFKENDDV